MNFSVTIAGLITMILTQVLGDTVDSEQIANFLNVAGLIFSSIIIWYGKYRQGDTYWWGGKK